MNLTETDLTNLRVAVELRAQACEENDDKKSAAVWRKLLEKVEEVKEEAAQ